MNSCIWILLLLFCCNGSSGCGSNGCCNNRNRINNCCNHNGCSTNGCGGHGCGCGCESNSCENDNCECGCGANSNDGCGCGNEYVAVTPDGDVYPCHQFVGLDGWKMGSIWDLSLDETKKADFARATVYDKPECQKCWAKFYCSGGCNANNLQYGGSIRTPNRISCELEKKRVECAIMIKAAEALV